MNLLRWILLAAGILLLVGIYWWGKRSKSAGEASQTKLQSRGESAPTLSDEVVVRRGAAEPSIGALDDVVDSSRLPPMSALGAPSSGVEATQPLRAAPESGPGSAELFVEPVARKPAHAASPAEALQKPLKRATSQRKIIALRLSASQARIDGAKLKALFDANGLTFGRYNIYHRMHDPHTPLFSVASMVEPGTFDPQAMVGMQFPGITLFMQLPGPIDGQEILSQMLACARQLEQNVGGALQDERGLALTEPRVQRLRDDVANFLHLLGQET